MLNLYKTLFLYDSREHLLDWFWIKILRDKDVAPAAKMTVSV